MADIGLSAVSVFFLQSPFFLAHQRQLAEGHGRSNCQTLFGIEQIPTDSHLRALLDPVPPEHFFGLFGDIVAHLESTAFRSHSLRASKSVDRRTPCRYSSSTRRRPLNAFRYCP